eukprot:407678-Prymnesium_polylepis.1
MVSTLLAFYALVDAAGTDASKLARIVRSRSPGEGDALVGAVDKERELPLVHVQEQPVRLQAIDRARSLPSRPAPRVHLIELSCVEAPPLAVRTADDKLGVTTQGAVVRHYSHRWIATPGRGSIRERDLPVVDARIEAMRGARKPIQPGLVAAWAIDIARCQQVVAQRYPRVAIAQTP